jgi:long-chain acyl-CoA synthetase
VTEPDTIAKLLRENARRWGDRVAFRDKELGLWNEHTWARVYEEVRAFSLGLVDLGLEAGAKVAIVGDNEPEWYWAAYAAYAARGVVVGLFTDAVPSEVEYVLRHAEARFVVARDQEQVDKILAVAPRLPGLARVIWWYPRGLRHYDDPRLASWGDVAGRGRRLAAADPGRFDRLVDEGGGDDIANIYYTSGTTGTPKGAMCSHRALIGSTRATLSLCPVTADDHILCYLPPAWIGEAYFGLIPHLLTGATLHTLEEPETVMKDIREVTPALILGGARQWEGWVSLVQARIAEAGWLERTVFGALFPAALLVAARRLEGTPPPLGWRLLHRLADLAVTRPIRAYLGLTRAKLPATAGSVLGPDTLRFIHALGVPLRQVYGSTEGGMITGQRDDAIRWGTIGAPLPGVEVRISPEGEILVRSPYLFSGYWKNEEATAQAFTDGGWWRSGDAGRLDDGGQLVYLDRVSELGELSSGARYSPQAIESGLRFSPYVRDAMVVGGSTLDWLAAVVIIDFVNAGRWAEKHRVAYTTYTDLSQRPEIARLIEDEVERLNRTLPPGVAIRRFVCLPKEFDPDEGDLTRTRKLKRAALLKRYDDLIAAVYEGRDAHTVEVPVTYQDGRQGVVATAVRLHTLAATPSGPGAGDANRASAARC